MKSARSYSALRAMYGITRWRGVLRAQLWPSLHTIVRCTLPNSQQKVYQVRQNHPLSASFIMAIQYLLATLSVKIPTLAVAMTMSHSPLNDNQMAIGRSKGVLIQALEEPKQRESITMLLAEGLSSSIMFSLMLTL